jgi:hypothetical protein
MVTLIEKNHMSFKRLSIPSYAYEDLLVWWHNLEGQFPNIMRNHVHQNHITLQLKLKKKLIYNYCATMPLEMRCINK